MGKGDRKSARGKRIIGSSGVTRKRKKVTYVAPVPEKKVKPAEETKKTVAKKAPTKKTAEKKTTAKKPAAKKTTKKTES